MPHEISQRNPGRRVPKAGDVLNVIIPALEQDGFRVIPGTAGDDGLLITRDGVDVRIDLDVFDAPRPVVGGSPHDDELIRSWQADLGAWELRDVPVSSGEDNDPTEAELLRAFRRVTAAMELRKASE